MDSDLDFPLSFPPSFAFFSKEEKRGVFNVVATTSFSDVLSPPTPSRKGTVSTRLRMREGSNLSSHSVQRRPDSTVDNAISCHQKRIIKSPVQISSRWEEGESEWHPLCKCDTWPKHCFMKWSKQPAPLNNEAELSSCSPPSICCPLLSLFHTFLCLLPV